MKQKFLIISIIGLVIIISISILASYFLYKDIKKIENYTEQMEKEKRIIEEIEVLKNNNKSLENFHEAMNFYLQVRNISGSKYYAARETVKWLKTLDDVRNVYKDGNFITIELIDGQHFNLLLNTNEVKLDK